jgi:hypothetical protein
MDWAKLWWILFNSCPELTVGRDLLFMKYLLESESAIAGVILSGNH